MKTTRSNCRLSLLALLLAIIFCAVPHARAQNSNSQTPAVDAFGDPVADPAKLFNEGQEAHAKGDLKTALSFYEQALKARPDFPEAEYQRGVALTSLRRTNEAEAALRHAAELKSDWALPHVALAKLFSLSNRDADAEAELRRALELDAKNTNALVALARLRLRAKAPRESLELLKRAIDVDQTNAALWAERGAVERETGDAKAAAQSLDTAINLNPKLLWARLERAALRSAERDFEGALADFRAAREIANAETKARIDLQIAQTLALAGRTDEAMRLLDSLKESTVASEAAELKNKIALTVENDPAKERAALEELIAKEPQNAQALARLGALTRTSAPEKSAEYYRRALELAPRNPDYATGYAAALVQARRFNDAVAVLRQVIAAYPDDYAAHANLATALDELKQFDAALAEYNWLNHARPDVIVTYYLIGRAQDMLGDYADALIAYETFLSRADPQQNKLEIERVNLRLPSLRNQIKEGKGKRKNAKQ